MLVEILEDDVKDEVTYKTVEGNYRNRVVTLLRKEDDFDEQIVCFVSIE